MDKLQTFTTTIVNVFAILRFFLKTNLKVGLVPKLHDLNVELRL